MTNLETLQNENAALKLTNDALQAQNAQLREALEACIDPLLKEENFPDTPEELMETYQFVPFEIEGEVLVKAYEIMALPPIEPDAVSRVVQAAIKFKESDLPLAQRITEGLNLIQKVEWLQKERGDD